jgi:hypothetical protein
VKSLADCQEHSRTGEYRETVRKTLTADLDEEGVHKNGPKGAHRRTISVREFLAIRQITVLKQPSQFTKFSPH